MRQSNFKFGDDINTYKTTSILQNESVQNNPLIISSLDPNIKSDLRKSHFILGNNRPNYETSFNAEFYDKSKLMPKQDKNLENIGKSLSAHNYEFGDDKLDYLSENAARYGKPLINKDERLQNKINNQLLQKSNYKFGNDKQPWNSTSELSFTPKYIPEEEKKNMNLVKTNFILGDNNPDYNTINSQTYKPLPYQYKPVDQNLLKDLRAHHYKLGNSNNPLLTQNQVDFQDPSTLRNNYEPTIDNTSLRKSNFKLGDALPSEIYNTTYNTIHTPKKPEKVEKNILRSSGYNLIGNNNSKPLDYVTDYSDNFFPKKRNLDSQKEMINLMKNIRKSHFDFGGAKNDFSTSSRVAYKFNPEEAKKAHNKLNKDILKDLRATHYKLGYSNDFEISTQKKDFIPYGIIKEGKKDIALGSIDLGSNEPFKGISIYQSDYTKKEINQDENDCYC